MCTRFRDVQQRDLRKNKRCIGRALWSGTSGMARIEPSSH